MHLAKTSIGSQRRFKTVKFIKVSNLNHSSSVKIMPHSKSTQAYSPNQLYIYYMLIILVTF